MGSEITMTDEDAAWMCSYVISGEQNGKEA